MASYKIAVLKRPAEARLHNLLGITYKVTGMLDDAIREFKKALELDPMLNEADYNLGSTYILKGLDI